MSRWKFNDSKVRLTTASSGHTAGTLIRSYSSTVYVKQMSMCETEFKTVVLLGLMIQYISTTKGFYYLAPLLATVLC